MAASKKSASVRERKRKPLVYLIDDEPTLLDLLEISLKGFGYTLKKFIDPEEALRSFLKERSKPDLLVTDYALGKMNGIELIERCRAAQPDLRIVMVSGSAGAEIAFSAPVKIDRFLGKPYQPATLAEMVQEVLAQPPESAA
jgi:CheY-like chemotaxis protein